MVEPINICLGEPPNPEEFAFDLQYYSTCEHSQEPGPTGTPDLHLIVQEHRCNARAILISESI